MKKKSALIAILSITSILAGCGGSGNKEESSNINDFSDRPASKSETSYSDDDVIGNADLPGNGTPVKPYLIKTKDDLLEFMNNPVTLPDVHYQLENDIEFNGEWTPVCAGEESFKGVFNGAGHSIKGLEITRSSKTQIFYGFIGQMEKGKIANLNLEMTIDMQVLGKSTSYGIGGEKNPGPLAIAATGGKMSYEVDDWGVRIKVRGGGTLTLPAFEFDGEETTRIAFDAKLVKVSYRGWVCRYATRGGTFADTGLRYFNRNGRYRRIDCTGTEDFEVFVTVLLKFMVPLVILGLVTAAIVEAGKNSGKMLVATFAFVIVSVIASGYFALGASVVTYPCVLPEKLANDFAALTTAEPYFKIAIPPPLDIMTTLALAVIGGLAIVFTKSEALTAVALDGKKCVAWMIGKIISIMRTASACDRASRSPVTLRSKKLR